MILLIDNYDSFTFNIVHGFAALGAPCTVRRNDSLSVAEALAMKPDGIVISPGPGTPDDAGICLDLIKAAAGQVPLLGICLGHQAIGQAFGARVVRAPEPMHGKVSPINHDGTGVFSNLPQNVPMTRYHSLVVAPESLPATLLPNAHTSDGVLMGVRHRDHAIHGVQFHPESIASEGGLALMANFMRLAGLQPKFLPAAGPAQAGAQLGTAPA
ncbi:aminodeoxychorismate/anthranilate synthase component II [Formicincola oecophyllae]|uniref:Aminodeoxychorismate/anthranilate synthase component II n=1 Tax=Formicincola oecophyllae TaxID=2558361 RepID=A0A4Y6UAM2_9PROT|nr:aminodeoxychorismate/anthranilate synthase component II [Formicincola oecophyllae]QDH13990.1 aminodeoxychorismate/anthranilate synthase component II [Formicincola oecophyllae]